MSYKYFFLKDDQNDNGFHIAFFMDLHLKRKIIRLKFYNK